jgi:nucleoside-diphosphate-sugar epimerase
VLGRGGLFGRLVRFVQISPIVPLVGGGDFPVRTVHISDLIKVTSRLLSENRTGVFTIAEPPGPTLGDLLQCLARVTHKKRLFVSIPTSVVERTLALADKMKLRLPVTRENLLGLASLAPQVPLPMEDFGLRNYEASLKDLFGSQ